MSAPWSGTAASGASILSTFTITAPTKSGPTGQVVRLRTLSASVSGATSAASSILQIADGSSVLMQIEMAPPVAGGVTILPPSTLLDYRTTITVSSVANNLVVGFASAVSGVSQIVNAQGDFVQLGAPANGIYTQS